MIKLRDENNGFIIDYKGYDEYVINDKGDKETIIVDYNGDVYYEVLTETIHFDECRDICPSPNLKVYVEPRLISPKVMDEINTLEELFNKMKYSSDGSVYSDLNCSFETFKYRLEHFIKHANDKIPAEPNINIIKMYHNCSNIGEIYEFRGHEYFITALEFMNTKFIK